VMRSVHGNLTGSSGRWGGKAIGDGLAIQSGFNSEAKNP